MSDTEKKAYEPMDIRTVLEHAVRKDVKDIFVVAGLPITFKIGNVQERMDRPRMLPADISVCVDDIYELSGRAKTNLEKGIDDDFSFALAGTGRFRVNVFRQRGSLAAVIRVIRFGLPDPAELSIPESVLSLADTKKGLVLITGSAGSGKSTTLACMIDRINHTREAHIITMEDPRSPSTRRAIWNPFAARCAKARTSSCWARCATTTPSRRLSRRRKPASCCSPRCIRAARRTRSTASWTCSPRVSSSR